LVVIGAGPVGLLAAREVASKGASVRVIEEHEEIGIPCHCAGLLSANGLREIEVKPDSSFIQNKVLGATFYSSSGMSFTIHGKEAKAYVVDRVAFDRFLAEQVKSLDVKILFRTRAIKILFSKNAAIGILCSGDKQIPSPLTIDAEGISRSILRKSGLVKLKAEPLPALQFEVKGINIDPNYVEIHLNKKLAPGFFIWVIPTSEHSARVGLAGKTNVANSLKNFVKKRFKNFDIISTKTGILTISGPLKRTYWSGIMVVGDAAGQVKPTTGGGVITGGICARIAGKVATDAISNGIFTESFLKTYEDAWRFKLGREFSTMVLARRILNMLPNESLEKIFQTIVQNRLAEVVEKFGDIDFQSTVILKMVANPAILKLLPKVLNTVLIEYLRSGLDLLRLR